MLPPHFHWQQAVLQNIKCRVESHTVLGRGTHTRDTHTHTQRTVPVGVGLHAAHGGEGVGQQGGLGDAAGGDGASIFLSAAVCVRVYVRRETNRREVAEAVG